MNYDNEEEAFINSISPKKTIVSTNTLVLGGTGILSGLATLYLAKYNNYDLLYSAKVYSGSVSALFVVGIGLWLVRIAINQYNSQMRNNIGYSLRMTGIPIPWGVKNFSVLAVFFQGALFGVRYAIKHLVAYWIPIGIYLFAVV